jgi:hypothetical protein
MSTEASWTAVPPTRAKRNESRKRARKRGKGKGKLDSGHMLMLIATDMPSSKKEEVA